jgi:hypothetical protein
LIRLLLSLVMLNYCCCRLLLNLLLLRLWRRLGAVASLVLPLVLLLLLLVWVNTLGSHLMSTPDNIHPCSPHTSSTLLSSSCHRLL